MTVSNTEIMTGAYKSYVNICGEDQAEAILFLHGSGPGVTAWSNWQFALPALDGQFHGIAPDLAGFGATEHPKNPLGGMRSWMRLWAAPFSGDGKANPSFVCGISLSLVPGNGSNQLLKPGLGYPHLLENGV